MVEERIEERGEDPIWDHVCLKGSSRVTGGRRVGRSRGQRAEGVIKRRHEGGKASPSPRKSNPIW